MRTYAGFIVAFFACGTIFAGEQLREFRWSDLRAAGQLRNGEIIAPGQGNRDECLLMENKGSAPVTVQILEIDQPGITLPVYALRGRIRYEAVEVIGYVEMWSYFPDGGAYFSRTLGESGPMGSLLGTSDWRELSLPFSAAGTLPRPSRLVINLVLPGKGRVWLGPLTLFQYQENENPLALSGAWWADRQGGLIGGIGGSVLGLMGAWIGFLVQTGRARSFVLGSMISLAALGVAVLAGGIAALALKQPYGVYYPLLLGGGLSAIIFGSLIPVARRRYAEIELRRMTAADVRS